MSASAQIELHLDALGDWRAETLRHLRQLILQIDPAVVEEWKWNVPVWSHNGIVCTGEAYKKAVKLTFAHGAALPDPAGLFNASLAGNTRRAIDIHEGETLDPVAFQALFLQAVAHNTARYMSGRQASPARASRTKKRTP